MPSLKLLLLAYFDVVPLDLGCSRSVRLRETVVAVLFDAPGRSPPTPIFLCVWPALCCCVWSQRRQGLAIVLIARLLGVSVFLILFFSPVFFVHDGSVSSSSLFGAAWERVRC